MQSVSAIFTAEEKSLSRNISQNLQISWHLQSTLGNKTFTIGVSTIGGNDVIGLTPGSIGSPSNYRYFDESAYAQSMNWERGYNLPQGGIAQGMAETILDNTSGRFLPSFMGGKSELFTAIQPRRPIIINAGFNIAGASSIIPQFSGLLSKQPAIDVKNRQVTLQAADFLSYFQNIEISDSPMYTGITTDQAIKKMFILQGMSTAQFRLDPGINTIPFFYYDTSANYLSDVLNTLVQSENGHLYQDETGIFRFENRQHWDSAPYTQVQKIITTSMVIDAQAPNDDHIVNIVQVDVNTLEKQSGATLYTLSTPIVLEPGNNTVMVNFANPTMQANAPTYAANANSDGSGSDMTGNVSITSTNVYAQSATYTFHNSSATVAYLTSMTITGRQAIPANNTTQIIESRDNESVTAFQEQILTINNPYIQNPSWAASLGQVIANTYGKPESLQIITIRAIPELQIGDLISWQGIQWRIWDIKAKLDPSTGFIQDLSLLKRDTSATYFRIGISTIGSLDRIAS